MDRARVRLTAGILWFVAIALMWELAWSLLDVPRVVGLFLATLVGLIVALDPLRVIWFARGKPEAATSTVGSGGLKPLAGGRLVAPTAASVTERSAAADAPARTAGIDL